MADIDQLFQTIRAYKSSQVLATAVELGMLDTLCDQERSAGEIASRCEIEPGYCRIFLRVLQQLGLVQGKDDRYGLTPLGSEASASASFRSFAAYHMYGMGAWAKLPECSRSESAGGRYHRQKMSDPHFCKAYLQAMESIAKGSLPFLRERCGPLLHGHILDIGAGPSTLCRHLAQSDDCRVTGLDLSPMVEMAGELFSYPDNYTWQVGDFHGFLPEHQYDGIFCSHFLEYCPEGNLVSWLEKIGRLIRPKGVVAFVVFLRSEGSASSLDLDLFEISTGLNSESLGHICTIDEMESALLALGFRDIAFSPVPKGASYSEYLVTCNWN
jgi:SAM-dependent methyltransferase